MGLPKIAVPEYSLTLPSTGEELKYRPFLVKEEKLLLIAMESEDEIQIAAATKNVIKNCIFEDINVDKLPVFDIEYIFLWLRARSKGEVIELKYKCPDCKGAIPVIFNVEDVKVHKNNEEHDGKIELTDNVGVVLKYPTLDTAEVKKGEDDSEVDILIQTILLSIDYIYDEDKMYSSKDHTTQEMTDFLESLNDEQFQKMGKFFESMPKLRHDVALECKNKVKGEGKKKDKVCGYKEDLVLEGLSSFFE